ncbi:hypothetical protein [Chromobacterium sp. IIBBL 290-4]|uniref:hypothetical protein n=1 Tax=Chromobacterium sp. IIBBL 290-4 TaxID=2953890 RepID=UPI0020B7BC71|nr:hypothetical protein [Chromobacterium sp. IIBBL 290-4]UTH73493.1 hypothetical protein NKT35_18415 [Chromobacterium sp. IIBBL 290-4]
MKLRTTVWVYLAILIAAAGVIIHVGAVCLGSFSSGRRQAWLPLLGLEHGSRLPLAFSLPP